MNARAPLHISKPFNLAKGGKARFRKGVAVHCFLALCQVRPAECTNDLVKPKLTKLHLSIKTTHWQQWNRNSMKHSFSNFAHINSRAPGWFLKVAGVEDE